MRRSSQLKHKRYYLVAGITIQVVSDLPITDSIFHPKFKVFEREEPGDDLVVIRHHFHLPDLSGQGMGKEVYRKSPWVIYLKNNTWIYARILPVGARDGGKFQMLAVFNYAHTRGRIYHRNEREFIKGESKAITFFPTDQILIGYLLADRYGCYMHACGVSDAGNGLLFLGHSGAGKSTIATMFKDKAEILCDDRIIIRGTNSGFRIFGTWHHGDVPIVSPNSAPLKAIFFLNKAKENRIELIRDKKAIAKKLLTCLIKPFTVRLWWDKTLLLISDMSGAIPCYNLYFDKSGAAITLLRKYLKEQRD